MKASNIDAFTLIELLVVIGIIAVLAGIILPVMSSSQATAQAAKCQANLRQIGIGLTLYANDNNNILSNSAYGSTTLATNNSTTYKWMDAIYPYASSEKIFLCPSDTGAKYRASQNLKSGETSTDYGSYGLNGAYSAAGDGQTPPRSSALYQVNRLQLEDPVNTVWVTDTNNRGGNGSFGFTWTNAGANPSLTSTSPRQLDKIIERHHNGTNVLFCDGHAELRKLETLTPTHSVTDPVDGATKNVMYLFSVESD
ncbi:MAG: prepilin-type N-terminal cleavage/methylation domain-containing protein [Chthoniobacterales bacterium]